jgi:hypothetical protein
MDRHVDQRRGDVLDGLEALARYAAARSLSSSASGIGAPVE